MLLRACDEVRQQSPVLLLHGSTLPGSLAFAARFDGRSWLDDLAARGFDAWTLDIRGYGGSWKPEDDERRPCTAVADTAQAISDVGRAVAFIRTKTGASSVSLVGWSWGATVAAAYAAAGHSVGALVLHAPQWLRDTPSPMVTPQTMNEPYRVVDQDAFVKRWRDRFSPPVREPQGWAVDLAGALGSYADQPIVVPNGSARDIATQWMAGQPAYDPANILAPTLVVVGSADIDTPPAMGRTVWARLASAEKVFREIPHGTHFTLFEPAREQLFDEVAGFLQSLPDRAIPGELA